MSKISSKPVKPESLVDKLNKYPKTTITAILGAVVTYLLGKGVLGSDEANLVSAILVALGVTVNSVTKR